ncbi:A/G-specific adenine glycosylase [Alkalicoccobacillus murimartini]|uniref:Adenine DNA glycosylase n=1 Tax=Alkalicoccobacillus murimartini TaxID=171685 RepID=A0ABT9YL99_9BACI|nr:A/G-specific adenine glycosylase [Alkalicoccobacillus murimartini]MDQ0208261.1 A/G-specific adenine glycosylase [Alkalicoccobacillus murimartini]
MILHCTDQININEFRSNLVTWFYQNQRELPWRENKDPYRVWVSEIMLQQTRVDTVIPYYLNFMRQFPELENLAEASEDEILKAWEGLGYYSRVRNLQTAVREVVSHYNGVVPDTREEISNLKGVGPYTAGAILSIAYDKAEPAVDGNVMRVLSRVLVIDEDIAKVKTRKTFERELYELIDPEDPSAFNQGLMELGALVCTPTSPGCLLCPVQSHCGAYHQGLQNQLPVKTKKKKAIPKNMAAFLIKNNKNEYLIEKRPETGLLAGLWQFPNFEVSSVSAKEELEEALMNGYGIETYTHGEPIQYIEHVFSHIIWNISVFEAKAKQAESASGTSLKWVSQGELEQYAFPVSHQKIITHTIRGEA